VDAGARLAGTPARPIRAYLRDKVARRRADVKNRRAQARATQDELAE
jgi:hypothetical protein